MSAAAVHTSHTVFIVDPDPQALASNARILSDAGYHVVTSVAFEEASSGLALAHPDVVIADIRLGAYNGLHLVFRARGMFPDVIAIVTDATVDPVLEAEADAAHVVYLVKPLQQVTLLPLIEQHLAGRSESPLPNSRRWPRLRSQQHFAARVGPHDAKVVDISYGGLRLETTDPVDVGGEVDLPVEGLVVHARPVWTRRLGPGRAWSGVAVEEKDPVVIDAWRRFVDKNQ